MGDHGAGEHDEPDELAELDAELDRSMARRVDPDRTALTVSIAMLVLVVGLVLPWTGAVPGWRILAGLESLGLLPRLFTFTSLGFGLVVSALALATRLWTVAWVAAAGCGISVVTGVWAIWSRQTSDGTGPGIGLIVTELAVLVLAASWARIAGRR